MEIEVLDKGFGALMQEIEAEPELTEVLKKLRQITALKEVLKSVGTFRAQSIKYAKLNAAALVRVYELGGAHTLRGINRKVAEWLGEMDPEVREMYIAKCGNGMTIDLVYKREVAGPAATHNCVKDLERMREEILDTVKETGIVEMNEYINEARKHAGVVGAAMISDWIDGTRNRLRDAGAVGLGSATGEYVVPGRVSDDKIMEAIWLRWSSICKDAERMIAICKAAKFSVQYQDLDKEVGKNERKRDTAYRNSFLLGLAISGVINNEDALIKAISKSDLSIEIANIGAQLRLEKDKATEIVYKNMMDRRNQHVAL